MAADVAEYLENEYDGPLFLEAPVGTGKSLGVLDPALRYCENKSKCILYATATISLQLQLMNEETKVLHKLRILRDDPLLAVGRDNYACSERYNENKSSFSKASIQILDKFFKESKTGQRFELEREYGLTLQDEQWQLISMKSGSCNVKECPGHVHRHQYKEHRKLTITNQDQLIMSYFQDRDHKRTTLNIQPGVIIIDEAHLFQQNFMQMLDICLPIGQLNKIQKGKIIGAVNKLKKCIHNMDDDPDNLTSNFYTNQESNDELIKFDEACHNLKDALDDYETERMAQSKKASSSIDDALDFFSKFVDDNRLSWYSVDDRLFHSIPLNFNDELRQFLQWLTRNGQRVILMSGTLTANGDSSDIDQDWNLSGFNEEFTFFSYPQTFDYEHQAIIYNEIGVPDPNPTNDNHLVEINNKMVNFVNGDGGSLILNSSKAYMDSVYQNLRENMDDRNILIQGEKTVETLERIFKDDKGSILVGSGSFFSGISVPGKSLETLVMTKLPFPTPDDPLIKVKSLDIDSNLPIEETPTFLYMVRQLKQGFGRLIRDIKDKGVIILLDPRLTTRNYGKKITSILNKDGYVVTTSLSDVVEFRRAEFNPVEHDSSEIYQAKTSDKRQKYSIFSLND